MNNLIKYKNISLRKIVFVFLILLLTIFIFNFLFVSNEKFENEIILLCENQSNLKIIEQPTIQYLDISVYPEIKNLDCLGNPYSFDSKNKILYIAFSSKLYNLIIYLIQVVFFLFLFINNKNKKIENLLFLNMILFYTLIYRYLLFIKTNMSTYGSVGENPFELKFDFSFIFLILLLKHYENIKFVLSLLLFIVFFKPSLIGFLILILFFKTSLNLKLNKNELRFLLSIPVFKILFWIISIPFQKFNILWLSLIQDPYSGLQRLPDMWLTLVPLKCQNDINYSTLFYFSDFKMSCPQDFYNPIFRFFDLKIEVWSAIIFLAIIFFIAYLLLYKYLIEQFVGREYIVSLFFMMPPLNFLLVTGNFDLFTFFLGFVALRIYKKHYFLSALILLFISLMEIHPISIIIGLIVFSLFKQDYKKLLVNIFLLVIFLYFIFNHNSSVSIQNQFFSKQSFGFKFEYVANQGAGIGLMLDIPKLIKNLDPIYNFIISTLFLLVLLIFILLKNNNSNSKSLFYPYKVLSEIEIIGYSSWLFFSYVFANQSYRLANFFIIFLVLFLKGDNFKKLSVILCCFLTPTTLIYGDFIFYLSIAFQRLGLFYIIYLLLSEFLIIIKKDKVEK